MVIIQTSTTNKLSFAVLQFEKCLSIPNHYHGNTTLNYHITKIIIYTIMISSRSHTPCILVYRRVRSGRVPRVIIIDGDGAVRG